MLLFRLCSYSISKFKVVKYIQFLILSANNMFDSNIWGHLTGSCLSGMTPLHTAIPQLVAYV